MRAEYAECAASWVDVDVPFECGVGGADATGAPGAWIRMPMSDTVDARDSWSDSLFFSFCNLHSEGKSVLL